MDILDWLASYGWGLEVSTTFPCLSRGELSFGTVKYRADVSMATNPMQAISIHPKHSPATNEAYCQSEVDAVDRLCGRLSGGLVMTVSLDHNGACIGHKEEVIPELTFDPRRITSVIPSQSP